MTFQTRKILFKELDITPDAYAPFLNELKRWFTVMDNTYEKVAGYYGFTCTGCIDNCCYTRFYHHTHVEYFYILEGYSTLDEDRQKKISREAADVCRKTAELEKNESLIRLMCPLNSKGMCILYEYRPMICRLHGIPHELSRPGQTSVRNPGCKDFTKQCNEKEYYTFDRTPFYIEMARLENMLKQALGIHSKFKMTIAQMLAGLKDDKE